MESFDSYFLFVYAKPKSHENKVAHWVFAGGKYLLQMRITAPPEEGKANKAIIALLAKTLDIAKSDISLISGAATRYKTFKIKRWSAALAGKLPKEPRMLTLFS